MADQDFLWPIDAPQASVPKVACALGFVEGVNFVREGDVFWFPTTDKAMLFNRSLVAEPNSGRATLISTSRRDAFSQDR